MKKGRGRRLGEAGEGKNITHQQKKLNDDELQIFRSRFAIPVPDDELHDAPFYRPADDSPEIKYMQERRKQLGGYVPVRKVRATPAKSARACQCLGCGRCRPAWMSAA